MNKKRGNLLFLFEKMLKFSTGSISSGLQVLYISISLTLLFIVLFSLLMDSVNAYGSNILLYFYSLLTGCISISLLAMTNLLGKHLNSFNRKLFFTLFSYIYLIVFIAPSNIQKLFKSLSLKKQIL